MSSQCVRPWSFRELIDRFLQHTSLGVNNLLLSALMESQRKLSEVAVAKDDIRDRLTMELEAAQFRHRNLEQAHRIEKETARRNEEALRSHCNEINTQWRSLVMLFYQ